MSQSKLDPCCSLKKWEMVKCISYADDLLFWFKNMVQIHELCQSGVDLEQEDDTACFLGVRIE